MSLHFQPTTSTGARMLAAVSGEVCSGCGRPLELLSPEDVDGRLETLEPVALAVLESQLTSLDERIRQSAAKLLLEWRRGKPKQQIQNQNDNVTTIRYETAAWIPDVIEPPVKELTP